MNATAVTLSHISKTLGTGDDPRVMAVDDLSLKIQPGEVVALLGESGSGKTTLLRITAGLVLPDSGDVLFDNVPLNDIPISERGIGMVFQDGALMPHWKAGRTVGFFLSLRKRQAEFPPRLARIAEITGFGMETLMARKPAQLSGGEKQRVAIARLLMRDPRVFLFDEPFSQIDAQFRAYARMELRQLLDEFPVTSLYVTHDQSEAVSLADRIAVMRAGKIEQIGAYEHLYRNPANQFVAAFMGTSPMNQFEGFVIDHRWRGVSFGGYPIRPDLEEGTRIMLGVRPEDVHLVHANTPAVGSMVEAVIETVMPHYAERYAELEVTAPGERWTLRAPLEMRLERGDRIRCTLDPDGLLFFDAETGRRIG